MSLSSSAATDNSLKQPPKFVKMNVDCWENVFDLLSLRDILAMSETCKRMRQMAGFYFREYLPDIKCRFIANRGVFIGYPTSILRTDFSGYITKLMVYDYLEQFLFAEQYCSLKSLVLCSFDLNDTQIDYIKNVLENIENVDLKQCIIYGDLYETFLKYCPKLKRLRLHDVLFKPESILIRFFQRVYPTIEHLDLSTCQMYPRNNELKDFLERNKNLKHFGVSSNFLWTNRAVFIESNAKLDSFAIYTEVSDDTVEVPAAEFINLLKMLYERKFFKSFHFKIIETSSWWSDYQEIINEMSTLDALEVLVTNENVDLSRLINLKELWFLDYNHVTDMDILATKLTKLERLYFHKASTDDIRPFFQHSKRLKSVKVYEMNGGSLLEGGIALNLLALNADRETLQATRRVSICVEEAIYVATKNRKKNMNLDHVEIARWESDEWNVFDQTYSF